MADSGLPRGGGANSPGRAPTYDFGKLSQNPHEIERIWTRGDLRVRLCFHRSVSIHRGRVKGKAINFTSLRTSSGQASQPYETVQNVTFSSPSEGGRKAQGENHQSLAVKGERHPTCGLELNPGHSGGR